MARTTLASPQESRKAWHELYRDARWQEVRLRILERDGWTCRLCGLGKGIDGVELQVHHGRYVGSAPWEAPDKYLFTLCRDCHSGVKETREALLDSTGRLPPDLYLFGAALLDTLCEYDPLPDLLGDVREIVRRSLHIGPSRLRPIVEAAMEQLARAWKDAKR